MNGSSTIITSTSPPESPRYQLNDNFSLTINDIKLGDSSTSYRCTVTIDDPNISGTRDRVYNQLGRITVIVYGTSFSDVVLGVSGVFTNEGIFCMYMWGREFDTCMALLL